MLAKFKLFTSFILVAAIFFGCGGGGSEKGEESKKVIVDGYSEIIDSFADFGPRDSARITALSGKIYLFSGWYRNISLYQDTWVSEDHGKLWKHQSGNTQPLNNELVSPIYFEDPLLPQPKSPIVVFNNSLITVSSGGIIRKSDDEGRTWQVLSYTGPDFIVYETTTLVVLDNVLILVSPDAGQVWRSADAVTWSSHVMTGFNPLVASTVTKAQGKLWIFGGTVLETGYYGTHNLYVWTSDDGVLWTKTQKGGLEITVPWQGRGWACSANDSDGNTWMLGGYNNQSRINLNDVWYTRDFMNWNKVSQPPAKSFNPVHAPACTYIDSKKAILMAGGKGSKNPDNDRAATTSSIWYFLPNYK